MTKYSLKIKIVAGCVTTIALAFLYLYLYRAGYVDVSGGTGHPIVDAILQKGSVDNDALTLYTEPEAGTAPVISRIQNAKKSVDIVIYTLKDKTVEAALAQAEARGVAVRVILNGGYKGTEPPSKKSTATFDRLEAAGVPVRWSHNYFDLTHQKTLVVDGAEALILTGNLDKTYYKKDRDFWVGDADPKDVAAIEAVFVSDWNGEKKPAEDGTGLIWSPGSEGELVALIGSAKNSLLIYNEEMKDVAIEDALEKAARRGVQVQVVMSMDAGWLSAFTALTSAGVHIRTFGPKAAVYIHAKMIVSDGKLAFLGSENFSDGSLKDNRELGLLFSKKSLVDMLKAQFQRDWAQATDFP